MINYSSFRLGVQHINFSGDFDWRIWHWGEGENSRTEQQLWALTDSKLENKTFQRWVLCTSKDFGFVLVFLSDPFV